jgi:hypothetical protein
MNSNDGIVVGRLGDRFRATLWEACEPVLWAEGGREKDAVEALEARMTPLETQVVSPAVVTKPPTSVSLPSLNISGNIRIVLATQGSLNNTYISVREIMDFFEPDTIGGNNKQTKAARKLVVEWGGQSGMETDIDGHHRSLRSRTLVSRFMRDSGLVAGDQVEIRRLAPYRYRLTRLSPE